MRRQVAGFTLVEMLVAVLVFALISAAGVVVLAQAADHQATVGARLDRLGEFQRARALLQADLSQVALRRVRSPDGGAARDAFAGRAAHAGRHAADPCSASPAAAGPIPTDCPAHRCSMSSTGLSTTGWNAAAAPCSTVRRPASRRWCFLA